MEEGFSFSDLLNGTPPVKRQRASMSATQRTFGLTNGKRRQEPITEDMDPDLTVRGRLHWVGVMKDWEWESKFYFIIPYLNSREPQTIPNSSSINSLSYPIPYTRSKH